VVGLMFNGGDRERFRREFPPKDCLIGLSGIKIPAQSFGVLEAYPQVIYKPRRLVVDRSYPELVVMDLSVGNCSQVMGVGEFPLDALLPVAPLEVMYERLTHFRLGDSDGDAVKLLAAALEQLTAVRNNLGRVDTCPIGGWIRFTLRNTSNREIDFRGAALYGTDGKVVAP
jgi:hypothetical protein